MAAGSPAAFPAVTRHEREQRRATAAAARPGLPGPLQQAAADGKTVRGAVRPDGSRVHLLSVFDVAAGCVRAQREIDAKTNEIPELAPAIAHLDLIGAVVTLDALHTQAETARHLVEDKNAHYLMIIKGNQPGLLVAVAAALAGPDADYADTTWTEQGTGHGRRERRSIRTVPADGIDLAARRPDPAHPPRHRGYARALDAQGNRLRHHQPARGPGRPPPPGRLRPAHWAIENREHYGA